MNSAAIAPSAVSFLVSGLLATSVVLRRGKSPLHWTLLAMLMGIVVWTGGAVWRHWATTRPELLAAFHVLFLGVVLVPPLWLLLAARFVRVRWVETRPALRLALLAPAPIFYAVFLSNESHGLFAHISMDSFEYGPVFWVQAGWAWLCVVGGIMLFLRRARTMVTRNERPRAALLATAALVPVILNGSYLLDLVHWDYDPTPVSLGFSAALMFPVIYRFRLLGNLPLLRRDVIEHLHDGVVIADARGTILDVNPAAVHMLDASADELRGESLRERVVALAAPGDRRSAERALSHTAAGQRIAIPEIVTKEGRSIRMGAHVVAGSDGRPAGQFVVFHDWTDERRSERALRQAQKLESVGFLAAGIAHEVNNPLAFVRANLGQLVATGELAKELAEAAPPDRREDLLEMPQILDEIVEGIERIAHVVASMRRLSRDAGEEAALADVNDAVREAAKLAQLARGFGPTALEITLAGDLSPVEGSRDGLIQVFLNLLLNAKQALADREGGRICLTTRSAGSSIEVVVEDDGPGIPEELQERIFDPFFTTKGPDEGTGLGLPIAYDIVREHRGTLRMESSPGSGARFTVQLPATRDC